MIKIKNTIFNENEIERINHIDIHGNRLNIIFKNNKEDYVEFATFDDIEWNYGQGNIKDDEYIELSNKYQRLLNRNEELEEENKKLKDKIEKATLAVASCDWNNKFVLEVVDTLDAGDGIND